MADGTAVDPHDSLRQLFNLMPNQAPTVEQSHKLMCAAFDAFTMLSDDSFNEVMACVMECRRLLSLIGTDRKGAVLQ